jgi:hypothetical protein
MLLLVFNEAMTFLEKVFVWCFQIYEDNNNFFWFICNIIENMPIWAEFSSTPNNRISLMSEWEAKIAAIYETRENVPFCWCPFLDACPDE